MRLFACALAFPLDLVGCSPDIYNTKPEVKGLKVSKEKEAAEPLSLIEVSDPQAKSQMALTVGQKLVLTLSENPSTGFIWRTLDDGWDRSVVVLESEDYISDPNPQEMVGVGGQRVFVFKAVQAGKTRIELNLTRGGQVEINRKSLSIKVSEGSL